MDLILVSMLIAVIEEAFSQAQEDLRAHREDDKLLQSFQSQVKSFKKFGGKLSNLGHMVRSRSVSKFKRGSGKSTEITNPAAALPRKMSFGSLIGEYLSEGAAREWKHCSFDFYYFSFFQTSFNIFVAFLSLSLKHPKKSFLTQLLFYNLLFSFNVKIFDH